MAGARVFSDKFITEHFLTEFYFINIGHEKCLPSHSFGPAMRSEYLLHYIEAGSGSFEIEGVVYQLGAGEFFLIRPAEITRYYASENDPWEYYWIGFNGPQTPNILALNGLGAADRVGKITEGKQLVALAKELLVADLFASREQIHYYSLFMQIFNLLKLAPKVPRLSSNLRQQQKYSEAFMLYVQSNYYRTTLSIHEIAQSLNLNSSYLTYVIKAELAVSPQQYLINYRLSKATILLRATDLAIYEIAERVGYDSSDAFARMVKQQLGKSPTHYRRESEKLSD